MTNRQTIVSAPGKVLLTGGYLVLEGKAGLVLSLDSRFNITLTDAQDA
jgi:phosphomevalonate kinase